MRTKKNPYNLTSVGENLYRNGLGTYFAIFKVGRKQIKKSLKTTDRAVAERKRDKRREEVHRLHGVEQRNIRFEELTKLWLESIRVGLKPSSYTRREVCLNGLTPFFKGMSVRLIKPDDIDRWRIKRSAQLSARSYNIELETLSLLFRYAIEVKRVLLDNPVEGFKPQKYVKPKVVIPTKQEFCDLLQALRNEWRAVTHVSLDSDESTERHETMAQRIHPHEETRAGPFGARTSPNPPAPPRSMDPAQPALDARPTSLWPLSRSVPGTSQFFVGTLQKEWRFSNTPQRRGGSILRRDMLPGNGTCGR
jgi:hypothetical protein